MSTSITRTRILHAPGWLAGKSPKAGERSSHSPLAKRDRPSPPPLVRGELEGGRFRQWLATGLARVLLQDCRGVLLLETVIASMVFAMVGVAVLAGLSTAYISGSKTEVQSVSENLARNQMEYAFSQSYREPQQTPYPTLSDIPTGYSVAIVKDFADQVDQDPEVESLTVTTQHEGQDVLTLQTLRGRDDGIQLRYSLNADRSNSARLHDATTGGVVYVFLDDPEARVNGPVDYYLNGGFVQAENFIPWDFQGGDLASANPWDTGDPLLNGTYTIKATVSLVNGDTVNVTAKFNLSN